MYEVRAVGKEWYQIFWISSKGRSRPADNIGYDLRQNANRRRKQLNEEILGECACGEPATINDIQSGLRVCARCWLKLREPAPAAPAELEALTAHLSAYIRPSTLARMHKWCESHFCSLNVALEFFL